MGREREQEVKWDRRERRWSQWAEKVQGGEAGEEEELKQRHDHRGRQGAVIPGRKVREQRQRGLSKLFWC